MYFLNVLELLESTGLDWKNMDSRNIEFFSSLLLLLPELISNLQMTIAKHHRTSSSCTLRTGLLHRLLGVLVDHVVAIGRVIAFDTS